MALGRSSGLPRFYRTFGGNSLFPGTNPPLRSKRGDSRADDEFESVSHRPGGAPCAHRYPGRHEIACDTRSRLEAEHTTMQARPDVEPIMTEPTASQAEQALHRARLSYSRTLACWTSDLLQLRRSGFVRPAWTPDDRDRDLDLAA